MSAVKVNWLSYSEAIFPGFSSTIISPEAYADFWIDNGYDWDSFYYWSDNYWNAYLNLVGAKSAEFIKIAIRKMRKGIIHDVEFDRIWSPQYYNTTNDRLFLNLMVDQDKLDDWILRHSKPFCRYLEDNWTCYLGFNSLVPNTYAKLVRSPYYQKITIEYFIREAVFRLGTRGSKDMETRLYDYITCDLYPESVIVSAEAGNTQEPFREAILAFA